MTVLPFLPTFLPSWVWRGQVADRLFSSFGQDILDALYWTATEPKEKKRAHIGVIPHFLMAVLYVCILALWSPGCVQCACWAAADRWEILVAFRRVNMGSLFWISWWHVAPGIFLTGFKKINSY